MDDQILCLVAMIAMVADRRDLKTFDPPQIDRINTAIMRAFETLRLPPELTPGDNEWGIEHGLRILEYVFERQANRERFVDGRWLPITG